MEKIEETNMEIRKLVKENGKETVYEAIVGEIWTSGYDERLADATSVLPDGEYLIMFEPDTEPGSDGIIDVNIYRLKQMDNNEEQIVSKFKVKCMHQYELMIEALDCMMTAERRQALEVFEIEVRRRDSWTKKTI